MPKAKVPNFGLRLDRCMDPPGMELSPCRPPGKVAREGMSFRQPRATPASYARPKVDTAWPLVLAQATF